MPTLPAEPIRLPQMARKTESRQLHQLNRVFQRRVKFISSGASVVMSALPAKGDIRGRNGNASFVPEPEVLNESFVL